MTIEEFIDEETYCCGSVVTISSSYDIETEEKNVVFKCSLCMTARKVNIKKEEK